MRQSRQPHSVIEIINSMNNTDFRNGQQHDAAEIIENLLDQIHSVLVIYSIHTDVIELSKFRSVIRDVVKGLSCSHRY